MNPVKHPKRPLVPGFLNRFDQWLLKNYPDIWSARTHLVVYFFLLLYLFMALASAGVPDDPRTGPEVGYWSVAAGLLGFVGMVLWFIYLFRFNVFKRYGNLVPGDRLRTFLQFYVSFLVIITIVFIPIWVDQAKTKMKFTDDEIVTDANLMNYYFNVAEKNAFVVVRASDTLLLTTASKREMKELNLYTFVDSVSDLYYPARLSVLKRGEMTDRIAGADSSRKLGNVGYIFYDIAELNFVSNGRADRGSDIYALTARDLYDTVYNRRPEISADDALRKAKAIAEKYYDPDDYYGRYGDYDYDYSGSEPYNYYNDPQSFMNRKHRIDAINSGIYHITSRMHPFGRNDGLGIFLFVIYFALALTLLLFAFRHSTIRTFFFTLLAGIVLSIITGLFMALTNGSFIAFLVVLLFYYAVFFTLSFTIPYSKIRSLVKGVALNFTLLLTFPVPVIATALYYEIAKKHYYATHEYNEYVYPLFPEKDLHLGLAQGFGGVILLGLLVFYFAKQYRLWYSQPEE